MATDITEPTFLKYNPKIDDNVNVLDDNEEQLIEKFFKPCYHTRVITFAETCPMYREKKFFEMLRYASQNTTLKDVMKQNYDKHVQGEKPGVDTAFTSNGVFGLSYSSSTVTGKRSSRKVDPNRFSSSGIKDNAIFGHPLMASVYNSQPTSNFMPNYFVAQGTSQGRNLQTAVNPTRKLAVNNSSDSIHLVITKMARAEYCQSLIAISPEYQNIWMELSKVINSRASLRRTYAGVGLSKSQAFLDHSPSPYTAKTKSPRGFNQESENVSLIKSRNVEIAPPEGDSPRSPRRFNFSLRLNDQSIRQLYQSDNRWSPRVTIPRTQ